MSWTHNQNCTSIIKRRYAISTTNNPSKKNLINHGYNIVITSYPDIMVKALTKVGNSKASLTVFRSNWFRPNEIIKKIGKVSDADLDETKICLVRVLNLAWFSNTYT